ncbi:cohesin domain-containing protein [Alkalibacter mobilis]|uniref:cohesin domain-containing protein n=1 Tax=Alkalibacter mobilis TaxID=2787712 RepID=UPI00189D662E|nr:cohesin domain-containing protein [Alkalibacter mobilis]MBF7096372.1 hypothetical protein [Alkalibacter mobilis]
MNFKIKKTMVYLLMMVLFLSLTPSQALAASASASASPSSTDVGKTVTVTVTFKDTNIGAASGTFSYDSSSLQYVKGNNTSNGKIAIVAGSEGATSLTATMEFKTLKAGSHKVSISGSDILDFEMNPLSSASTSTTITVKAPTAPTTPTPKPKPTTSTPKPTAPVVEKEPEPDPMEKAIEVSVDGKTFFLWPELDKVKLPDGFEKVEVDYKEDKIDVASNKNEKIDLELAYFTDQDGKNGEFYVYDKASQSFYTYTKLSSQKTYVILKPDDTVVVPEGYVEQTVLTIDDKTYDSWAMESGENSEFPLVYAMNDQGEKSFYIYDTIEGTMQRFSDRTVEVEVEVEVEPEPLGPMETIFGNPVLSGIFAGLGLLSAGLAAALIMLIQKNKA